MSPAWRRPPRSMTKSERYSLTGGHIIQQSTRNWRFHTSSVYLALFPDHTHHPVYLALFPDHTHHQWLITCSMQFAGWASDWAMMRNQVRCYCSSSGKKALYGFLSCSLSFHISQIMQQAKACFACLSYCSLIVWTSWGRQGIVMGHTNVNTMREVRG